MRIRYFDDELADGWSADVIDPPQLGEILMSMQSTRRGRPIEFMVDDPVAMWELRENFKNLSQEELDGPPTDIPSVIILVRVTMLRTIFRDDWELPEFEFEGIRMYSPRFDADQTEAPLRKPEWLRGALKVDPGWLPPQFIAECTLYKEFDSEVTGTKKTKSID